jgi:hypothetical protein
MNQALRGIVGVVAAPTLVMAFAAAAFAQQYTFTKVADSSDDGFDPFSFECSAINNRGDIAFRTARPPENPGPIIQGIYRADAGTSATQLTTIAEFGGGFDFLGQIPSINDRGEISFAITHVSDGEFVETQRIMRGSGARPATIASTEGAFNRFGFEPTINNRGAVAFKADLDAFDTFDHENGLFSGSSSARIATRYRSSTSQFSEFSALSRPSINNFGAIAFEESVDGESISGIFLTTEDGPKTIAAPDPDVIVGRPNLNDAGTVAFHRFFNSMAGEELVIGNGGPLSVLADTSGPFESFGFYLGFTPPALNNEGEVAFLATLDTGGSGIFVGPDPVADRVIGTGDTLEGLTITNLRFCDEGLNDSGQLVFQATLDDPSVPEGFRVAIYRATPTSERRSER